MTYKAIIFDMDGVLFETEEFYFERRANFLASRGLSVSHLDPSVFVGGRASQMWSLILGEDMGRWDIPKLEAEYRDYKDRHRPPYGERLFPEVKRVLAELKDRGLRLALASNTDMSDVQRALAEAGIVSYFDAVFSAMDCRACKPDPEVYNKARTALGATKEETLVIEDSEKGIQAGVSAGLAVWAIRDKKWGIDQSQSQRRIDDLSVLLDLLEDN